MKDAVALTGYLRDYIWSIGITQMRTAAPGGESPAGLYAAPAAAHAAADARADG